jgi:hypothetical protein
MALRIASRGLLALRNVAAGLALIVTPILLYLGVGGQAAQAQINPDWTLQAGGTTVCTTFTAFYAGSTTIGPPPSPTVPAWILSGGLANCDPPLTGLLHNPVPETFAVSREICSGGTPEKQQYVFGGASVRAVQLITGGDSIPTVEAQFTYQSVAITNTKPGGSC